MKRLIIAGVVLLLLLLACAPAPEPVQQVQEYNVYMPMVRDNFITEKGVIMAVWTNACRQADIVGAKWMMGWWPNAPACVKDWDGTYIPFVATPDRVHIPLEGTTEWVTHTNEPEMYMSYCHAAWFTHYFEEKYPDRKQTTPQFVGNDYEYVENFERCYEILFKKPYTTDAVVFHCYASAAECIERTKYFVQKAKEWEASEVWVGEFASRPCLFPDNPIGIRQYLEQDRRMVEYWVKDPMVTKFFFFTNEGRAHWPPSWPGCDYPRSPHLFEENSLTLTVQGKGYREAPRRYNP